MPAERARHARGGTVPGPGPGGAAYSFGSGCGVGSGAFRSLVGPPTSRSFARSTASGLACAGGSLAAGAVGAVGSAGIRLEGWPCWSLSWALAGGAGVFLLGAYWLNPRAVGAVNRRQAYRRGLRDLGWLALPALVLFVTGAIYEAFSLRYFVHPLAELLL